MDTTLLTVADYAFSKEEEELFEEAENAPLMRARMVRLNYQKKFQMYP